MKDTPINYEVVQKHIADCETENVGQASIREIRKLINKIENETEQKFIRMEMGIPGLPAPQIGIDAEKKALDNACAEKYPPIDGIPELKDEISKFVKLFMNIDVSPRSCMPTVGAINGNYVSTMVTGRKRKSQNTVLCLAPGFPVHKQMIKMLGLNYLSFDVYNYRGKKLKEKLESYFKQGSISSLLYSNPNNPSWISFTEEELQIIGELATKYNVTVTEDLAYFGMDFRKDLSKPGKPPYQATVARYTKNYIILISSSKVFSYPGQRIGMMVISDGLYEHNFEDLLLYYPTSNFGHSLVLGTLYATTAGVAHSAQHGLTAILRATNSGKYNFIEVVKEYGKRAKIMKEIFSENGFNIVYDTDIDEPIADGFYFTVSYPGYTGEQLVEELFYYGISSISLSTTGSERVEGIRACVSHVYPEQFPELEKRLKMFKKNNKL